jgi:hypothetical protein
VRWLRFWCRYKGFTRFRDVGVGVVKATEFFFPRDMIHSHLRWIQNASVVGYDPIPDLEERPKWRNVRSGGTSEVEERPKWMNVLRRKKRLQGLQFKVTVIYRNLLRERNFVHVHIEMPVPFVCLPLPFSRPPTLMRMYAPSHDNATRFMHQLLARASLPASSNSSSPASSLSPPMYLSFGLRLCGSAKKQHTQILGMEA